MPSSKSQRQISIPLTLMLLVLSVLSGFFSLPMLYGMQFQFTTLFLILILILIGSQAALIIALITACSHYFLIQMPVLDSAMIIVELIILITVFKLRSGSVFLYDLLFWLITSSCVLIFSFYTNLFTSNIELLLYLAKSSLNGSANALAAEVMCTYLFFFRQLKTSTVVKKIPLQQILVHLSMCGLVLPFVCFMIMTGISMSHVVNSRALQQTQSKATSIQEQLSQWHSAEYRALELKNIMLLGKLKSIVDNSASDEVRIVITDHTGGVLVDSSPERASDRPVDWSVERQIYKYNESLYLSLPLDRHVTELSKWDSGFYWYKAPLYKGSTFKIEIRVQAAHFLSDVYSIYAIEFSLIMAFTLVVLLIVYWISKSIVHFLIKLAHETSGLPNKITAHFEVSVKESHIVEFDKLYGNFRKMAYKLKDMFTEELGMNTILKEQAQRIRQSELEFQQLAFTDMLTKIPNRLYFHKRLKQLIEEQAALSLMFMDLNKFKQVNDTYGHEAGDLLLQHVARLLTSAAGMEQVFRLGGDEFVVVLMTTERNQVKETAEHIHVLFKAPLLINGHTLQPRTSIGIARCPQDTENPDELLKLADQAMYRAKESGVDVVWHNDPFESQGDV